MFLLCLLWRIDCFSKINEKNIIFALKVYANLENFSRGYWVWIILLNAEVLKKLRRIYVMAWKFWWRFIDLIAFISVGSFIQVINLAQFHKSSSSYYNLIVDLKWKFIIYPEVFAFCHWRRFISNSAQWHDPGYINAIYLAIICMKTSYKPSWYG